MGIQEAMADAMLTGASLHIVHINSMALSKIQLALDMIEMANKKGFDISTEMYPYTAASTLLQSALFNDNWQEKLGMTYGDLQWVATGERLTKETFESYRKSGGTVIMHMMKPEWIKIGLASPKTMIASDGMPYAPLAHPRTAGTFSRVLGKYVREEKVIDLMTAIGKMSYLPAKRLESIAPSMHHKGRIQVGADADISIFNPNTISDKASFEKGLAFSEGMEYVLVNGKMVLKNGKILNNTFAGQPIYGKFKK
jgi:dihydroorotase